MISVPSLIGLLLFILLIRLLKTSCSDLLTCYLHFTNIEDSMLIESNNLSTGFSVPKYEVLPNWPDQLKFDSDKCLFLPNQTALFRKDNLVTCL